MIFFYFEWLPKPYGISQKRFAGVGFDGKKRSLISLKAACVRNTSNFTKEQLVNSIKKAGAVQTIGIRENSTRKSNSKQK